MATKKSNKQLFILLALIVAVAAAILLLPSCGGRTQRQAGDDIEATTLVGEGDQAPDFTVEMIDGSRVTLSALRGKVVLVNFWATWCPPCREELTHVQRELIDRFAGRDFVFLPISRGEERAAGEAFRKQTGHTCPMALDPAREAYDRYASNYIPRNFLVGPDGKVIAATVGFDEEEFAGLIDTIERTLENQ